MLLPVKYPLTFLDSVTDYFIKLVQILVLHSDSKCRDSFEHYLILFRVLISNTKLFQLVFHFNNEVVFSHKKSTTTLTLVIFNQNCFVPVCQNYISCHNYHISVTFPDMWMYTVCMKCLLTNIFITICIQLFILQEGFSIL